MPLMRLRKSPNASDSLTVNIADVILRSDEDYNWTFSGLNVDFHHCQLESLQLVFMKNDDHSENTTQIPIITFYNSSFKSLDLCPEIRAEIIDCYIDANNESRPTLITSNNSNIVIRNSTFLSFDNEDGPTILDGQINCSVSVENSIFSEHWSKLGVLVVRNNSRMKISNTSFCGNMASLRGGAVNVNLHSRLNVTYCLFEDNTAESGGAIYSADYGILGIKNTNFHNNHGGVIHANTNVQLIVTNCTMEGNSADYGAVIYASRDIQLLVTDCTIKGNTAGVEGGGAIRGADNVTLEINNTKFNNNKASTQGGAIYITRHVQLLVTNCTLEENSAEYSAGAVQGENNATLKISNTKFNNNKAVIYGGAIFAYRNALLIVRNCTLDGNSAEYSAGAVAGGVDSTLEISNTKLSHNKALAHAGGAIGVQANVQLLVTNCTLDGNSAGYSGGAVWGDNNIMLEISNTEFINNKGLGDGGAIIVYKNAQLLVTDCTLDGNSAARYGGAIFGLENVKLRIDKSNFKRNRAAESRAVDVVIKNNCSLEVRFTLIFGLLGSWEHC